MAGLLCVMDRNKLINNITDQIVEAQIKLGFAEEKMIFYYPLNTLNKLLGESFKNIDECVNCCNIVWNDQKGGLGKLLFNNNKNVVGVTVSSEGVKYVYENVKPSLFLITLIEKFKNNHHLKVDEIEEVFAKFGEYEKTSVPEDTGFMYAIWFKDGKSVGDEYVYCINIEMGHTIYHRFTRDDYDGFINR